MQTFTHVRPKHFQYLNKQNWNLIGGLRWTKVDTNETKSLCRFKEVRKGQASIVRKAFFFSDRENTFKDILNKSHLPNKCKKENPYK